MPEVIKIISRFILTILLLDATTLQAGEFFPLSDGNYWKYKETHTGYVITDEVRARRTVSGNKWYLFVENDFGLVWMGNTGNGVVHGVEIFDLSEEDIDDMGQQFGVITDELIYKYPVDRNGRYYSGGSEFSVINDVTVHTPAGAFKCTMYID